MRPEGDGGESGADEVVAVQSLVARPRESRRPQKAGPPDAEPDAVAITRVTVVGAQPFGDPRRAAEWLRAARGAPEDPIERALRTLNRTLQAHRVASGDPHVREVSRAQAQTVRLGYGSGEALIEGRWSEALVVPSEAAGGRRRALEPQQQTAAILGGRRPVEPSEDLLLRARLDLDHGRLRQAALQAEVAARALAAELTIMADAGVGDPGAWLADARAWLTARLPQLEALAVDALQRTAGPDAGERLQAALAGMERIARRRRHRPD